MKYAQDEGLLKALNERGWNLYAVKDAEGKPHGHFGKIIENGLAVPWDEFFRRQQQGDTKGIQLFGVGDTIEYLLFPKCDNPNSTEDVHQRLREVKKAGGIAAYYAGSKLTLTRRDTQSLESLPDLQNIAGQT